jgi:hypothetical protein
VANTVLRGYEWVTVVAAPLAQRLGGAAGVQETKAFHHVEEVADAAVWLQATESFAEYDEVHVRSGFEALRPVLPNRRLTRRGLDGCGRRGTGELCVPQQGQMPAALAGCDQRTRSRA